MKAFNRDWLTGLPWATLTVAAGINTALLALLTWYAYVLGLNACLPDRTDVNIDANSVCSDYILYSLGAVIVSAVLGVIVGWILLRLRRHPRPGRTALSAVVLFLGLSFWDIAILQTLLSWTNGSSLAVTGVAISVIFLTYGAAYVVAYLVIAVGNLSRFKKVGIILSPYIALLYYNLAMLFIV